jgi:predicted nucleic acid-binding protein
MLLDSNILVYAINIRSPKHKLAQLFILENLKDLIVAHQNILETLRVLTHPKFPHPLSAQKAIEEITSITEACKVISPNNKTHYLALELINRHNLVSNNIFDAYLAATALSNNITIIATDNTKEFQNFGLTLINPFL